MSQIFSFEIFFLRVIFIRSLHIIFFNRISKMFCNFLLQLNITERRHVFFCALGEPETEEYIELAKNKIHLTCKL